jgi:hypothetical protein
MQRRIALAVLLSLPLAIACAGSGGGGGGDGGAPVGATESATVICPSTGLTVTVALASAHLGDEKCTHDESQGLRSAACAIPPDSGAPTGTGACGGPCDFSRVQLTFTSEPQGSATPIAVTSAVIIDVASGAVLQAISAYTPLAWDGAAYRPWDEIVPPAAAVKASYTLAPPSWSSFDTSYSTSRAYRVRLVLRIDGRDVTVESSDLHREPVAAT